MGSCRAQMFWVVLIRSTLMRCFRWVPTTNVCIEKLKYLHSGWKESLTQSYVMVTYIKLFLFFYLQHENNISVIPALDKVLFSSKKYFFFFFFFWFGFYGPFKNISLISSRSFIEGGRKPENPEKNHLTIRKQNLAFPHMTRARLEPQRWET